MKVFGWRGSPLGAGQGLPITAIGCLLSSPLYLLLGVVHGSRNGLENRDDCAQTFLGVVITLVVPLDLYSKWGHIVLKMESISKEMTDPPYNDR